MSKICDDLRAAILQAAMQGKLTERLPEDGSANDLLEQIQQKKTLSNEKIRPIFDKDILFEIPDSWKWARLGEIVDFSIGKTPPRAEVSYWGNDIPWVSIADMPENDILLSTKEKVSNKAFKEKFSSKKCPKGTLIMSFKLTVGRCSILGIDAVHNEAIISIRPLADDDFAFRNYLARVLPFLSNCGETKDAIKGRTLNSDSLNNLMVPIPPLAEQKRIVEKVDELMTCVADLEQSTNALETLKKNFPDDIKASLLQAAMQGKLTERLPEDGNAEDLLEKIRTEKERLIAEGKIKKQKALAPITDEEIPFSVPENWRWVRIGDITFNHGQKTPDKRFSYIDVGTLDNTNHRLNDVEQIVEPSRASSRARKIVHKGDIIYATIRPYLHNICIIDRDFSEEPIASTAFAVMSPFEEICNKYLFWALLSPNFDNYANRSDLSKGVAYPAISEKDFFNGIIPLPPLTEQKRIVERLNALIQNLNEVQRLILDE